MPQQTPEPAAPPFEGLDSVSDIYPAFHELLARSAPTYDVEWGVRTSDGALVMHFFPPGYALDNRVDWPNWHAFRDAFEAAVMALFKAHPFEVGYAQELRSFHLILKPAPQVPDLAALLQRFFQALESPSRTGSES